MRFKWIMPAIIAIASEYIQCSKSMILVLLMGMNIKMIVNAFGFVCFLVNWLLGSADTIII